MIYKDFQDIKISQLAFGCMRLPLIDGDDSRIDKERASAMFKTAFDKGVNYFDTAWGYHGGQSELAVGEILSKYPRESFYLASKFPGYDVSNFGKTEEIFEKQLEKCRVEYFDFYLFHNVAESNIEQYLDDSYGTFEYLWEQKQNGRIRHLGLSAHGSIETMKRFLEKFGKYMEFCQLQINYIDWDFQDAKGKVELCKEYGIPVWVMEPVRGGKLAKLDERYEKKMKEARPDESIAAWAFRFLQTIPEVVTILSGMTEEDQVEDNLKTFSEDKPLNAEEMKLLKHIVDDMTNSVPCTKCKYCITHCPQGIDIPWMIELYNEHKFSDGGFIAPMALSSVDENKKPSACIGCRSCEQVCPQSIKISEVLADFVKIL